MKVRRSITLPRTLVLAALASSASGRIERGQPLSHTFADAFDCKAKIGDTSYDLSALTSTPLNVTQSVSTPPTTTFSSVLVSLCSPLDPSLFKDDPELDRCPEGTRVCVRVSYEKEGKDRTVLSVVPMATNEGGGKLEKGSNDGTLLLTLNGAYANRPQSFRLLLTCPSSKNPSDDKPPSTFTYDSSAGTLKGEWTAAAACGTQADGGKKDDREEPGKGDAGKDGPHDPAGRAAGGWIGTFFLLLLLGFLAYLGIGMYRNYQEYGVGASYWDLVPHRDVWREIPYVVRDLLFRRPGRGGGYTAL